MWLLLLSCVPADPPVRSMLDLSRPPSRGLPFETEGEVHRLVVDAMAEAGVPRVEEVRFEVDEHALYPLSVGSEVHVRPFVTTPSDARAHLAEIGVGLWGAPLLLPSWSDDDLFAAWLVFHVAAIGHELSHGVSSANNARDHDDLWVEERRARDVEWPLLNRLAEHQRIPAAWLPLYSRFLRAVAEALPPASRAPIPDDPAARRALFDRGYRLALGEPEKHDPEAVAALWMAIDYSAGLAEKPAVRLDSLVPQLTPWDDPTARRVAEALADSGLSRTDVGWEGPWRDSGVDAALTFDEPDGTVRGWASVTIPPLKATERAPVLRLLNAANGRGRFTASLRENDVVVIGDTTPGTNLERIVAAVDSPVEVAKRLASRIPDVRAGKVAPEAAWATIQSELEAAR